MARARGRKNSSRFQYRSRGTGTRLASWGHFFLTMAQLRLTSDIGREKGERFVITAALAIWNVIVVIGGDRQLGG